MLRVIDGRFERLAEGRQPPTGCAAERAVSDGARRRLLQPLFERDGDDEKGFNAMDHAGLVISTLDLRLWCHSF